jgi:hypothetical protein
MAVDSATHIASLNAAMPAGGDTVAEADDNIRHVKTVLVTDFPNIGGPVTATHTQLNHVVGVTSPIQTQLDAKGAKAGQVWTGAHDFTDATLTVPPATTGSQPYTKTQTDALVIATTAPSFSPTTTAVSKTLAAFEFCVVTASGQTISLPAAPTDGVTVCRIRTRAGITTTVGRNGNPIQGLAEDMSIPFGNVTVTLGYVNSTDGWALL